MGDMISVIVVIAALMFVGGIIGFAAGYTAAMRCTLRAWGRIVNGEGESKEREEQ